MTGATLLNISMTPDQEGRPLHLQVKSALAADLTSGSWKPGEKLPTEGELSRHFGVSEGTVRQAIVALVKEGRLTRRSGKGTFAARPNFERSFARFYRFRDGRKDANPQYGVRVIGLERNVAVDAAVAGALGARSGVRVLSIHRAIEQDGVAVCHSISYLRQDRFGSLTAKDLANTALYDVMQSKFGVYIVRVVETLQARVARDEDCTVLEVKRNSPVIAIERRACTYGDQVVEVRRTVARSDRFSYQIELS